MVSAEFLSLLGSAISLRNSRNDEVVTDHIKSRQIFTVGPDPVIITLQFD